MATVINMRMRINMSSAKVKYCIKYINMKCQEVT